MIQADKLSISYEGVPVFEEVTFSLQKKERCGLVGRNGSGKTTLLRLITGQEAPDTGRVAIPKNYRLGYLDQYIQFTQSTLLEEAALGLRPEEREHLYKVEKILFGLGFKEEDLQRAPDQFSGGYHLRLHLAKVLAGEPNCLLLDEPTNYLDILSIRWFMHFLQEWKGEFILITHDREFMDGVTTHTMGIHRKKVRKIEGSTIKFFEQIVLEEEIQERTRINLSKKREHLQSYIDRFGAKASKAAQAQSRKKALGRIPVLEKLMEIYQLEFHFNEHPFMGEKMLEAKDLAFSYAPNDPFLIKNVSLIVEKGARVAVIGKNGYGKSTLLRLLAKELDPSQGLIKHSDAVRLGYFGQTNIQRLSSHLTIEEEIASANPQLNYTEVKGICGLMMFGGDLSKKPISVLSGGEKSRVLLGKILARSCNLLFLDEPTHHLDMESIEALIDALEEFTGGVIIVTHSELILRRLELDKILICHRDKQELFDGSYDAFLSKVGWQEEKEAPKVKKKEKEIRKLPSPALKQLKIEINSLENAIILLEEEQKQEQQLLIKAYASKDATIPHLQKSTAERQKKIDELFLKLEQLASHLQELK